jgi:hypothetical protein
MPQKIKDVQPFYWCKTCQHSPSWHDELDGRCRSDGCKCEHYETNQPLPAVPGLFDGEPGEFAADVLDQIESGSYSVPVKVESKNNDERIIVKTNAKGETRRYRVLPKLEE